MPSAPPPPPPGNNNTQTKTNKSTIAKAPPKSKHNTGEGCGGGNYLSLLLVLLRAREERHLIGTACKCNEVQLWNCGGSVWPSLGDCSSALWWVICHLSSSRVLPPLHHAVPSFYSPFRTAPHHLAVVCSSLPPIYVGLRSYFTVDLLGI